jgi:hypothetical protein
VLGPGVVLARLFGGWSLSLVSTGWTFSGGFLNGNSAAPALKKFLI